MKKRTVVIACFSLAVVLLGGWLFWTNQSEWAVRTKTITQQQAIKEMPLITITDEEFLFMQLINQNSEIQKAIKDDQITDSIIKKGNELAKEILSDDIQTNEFPLFSVGKNVIYIDYVIYNHRVILTLPENGTIIKVAARYSKNEDVKTICENVDNKEYRKSNLVPQFWANMLGN